MASRFSLSMHTRFTKRRIVLGTVLAGFALAAGLSGCVVVPGYATPAPVYVAPAPVYVAPGPVYVAPAPVYVWGGGRWHRHRR